MTQIASSTSTTALPEAWVERLFERMLLEYGKRFADQWAQADMDKLIGYWAQELSGFSGNELKRGLDALSQRDWPPTLPEFKRLCRPRVDPVAAYYEAVTGVQARFANEHGKWTHPAIYWAAMPMASELQQQPYSAVKARWEASLDQQLALGAWDEIPKPMLQLTAPGKSTTNTEKARAAIAHAVRCVSHKGPNHDHLGWARRLAAREQAGESLLPYQVQCAHEALEREASAT
ncbi:hypothetical protein [Massilia timonae]|uniref:hypothetical protein n=2 Tax=Massilia timonae TaxID=47229 RepID=UPI0028A0B70A|nr:hypothetical protein [Massilia timonae]